MATMSVESTPSRLLWKPTEEQVKQTQIYAFKEHIAKSYNIQLDDYAALQKWSVDNIVEFWSEVWEWGNPVIASKKWDKVIDLSLPMQSIPPWFEGARLNWAENMLRPEFRNSDKTALIQIIEPEPTASISYNRLSYSSLYSIVHSTALALQSRGLEPGQILGYYGPTSIASVVFCLAATSLGAIWSSAASDFGSQGVLERFEQFGEKLWGIVGVDGVRYNGKRLSQRSKLNEVVDGLKKQGRKKDLPVILVDYLEEDLEEPKEEGWVSEKQLRKEGEELKQKGGKEMEFYQTGFDHPLWVLFSSGTTGKPKPIVHRAGGMLLQSKKEHVLHGDMTDKDVFFYFTTPGWMMYNYLISGLQTGCSVVVYDGSPLWKPELLWQMAEDLNLTIFGTSAKYIDVLSKNYSPNQHFKLASLKQVLSTGSPLKPESFDWVYKNIKKDVLLGSITGGTDICSLFAGHNVMLPVYEGEIQGINLGMAIESFSEDGKPLPQGTQGDLVCTKPFPCMPVYFWNDEGNVRYHASYFDKFEGVWAHGDFTIITPSREGNGGGLLMLGRSDGVLNREFRNSRRSSGVLLMRRDDTQLYPTASGIRFGSSEIYEILDTFPQSVVVDSLVVGQKIQQGSDERVVLFVKLGEGQELSDDLIKQIKMKVRLARSARHVPERILQVQDVPHTVNGKKVEIPIKKLLSGAALESINFSTLKNPECLEEYVKLGEMLREEVN